MPTPPFNATNPLLAVFAPWLAALPSSDATSGVADAATPLWSASLESQARLWSQMLDAQRNFWSMYTSLFQGLPMPLGGTAKTVAQDELGLEPAETADGIPDPLELQMRTWNHLLDANRSFWTAINWPGIGDTETDAGATATRESTPVAPVRAAAPRKRARAKR